MKEFVTYNYIINKLRNYNKIDLLKNLNLILRNNDLEKEQNIAIWQLLLLIKLTYLNAGKKYPSKILTKEKFLEILENIREFENKTLAIYADKNEWGKIFKIIGYQQFYLQHVPNWIDFARLLKLFETLKSKYDVNIYFESETGLTIKEFICISFFFWAYFHSDNHGKNYYNGFITKALIDGVAYIYENDKTYAFIDLLSLNIDNAKWKINNYKKNIQNSNYQIFEISVFTMYPFQTILNNYIVTHRSLYDYTCIYYLYDFLKEKDTKFTEEFGARFEKYVEYGLKEIEVEYLTEKEIKKKIGKEEKVVDFLIDSSILLECKGIEPKPYPSVNPDDKIIYNELKSSIIKAYTQQMFNVIKKLNTFSIKYGIIVTYKDFYLSSMNDLWEIVKEDVNKFCVENNFSTYPISPNNVLIIDINSWDNIIQIIKDKKATFQEIIEKVIENNNHMETKKISFHNHIKSYKTKKYTLSYLQEEYKKIGELFKKNKSKI